MTNLPGMAEYAEEHPAMSEYAAITIVIGLIILACFVIGVVVRWRVGRFIHGQLEHRLLRVAPGYKLIKETVMQLLGNRPSPFASVALVQLFGNDTLATAFGTERHDNGMYSVFVPTGPNPTSGNIYHLKPEYVHHLDHPVEDVMRSIISCGAGSDKLIKACAGKTPLVPAAVTALPEADG